MSGEKIRESVIAGSWYPDHPDTLRKEIRRYLDQASPSPINGELVGLVAPHAGYMYSGGVAAFAFKLLEGKSFDRVLVVAPSHRAHFPGASVYSPGGYRTPLGVVPLDRELVDKLLQHSSLVSYVPQAHSQEHSLEIQLPFLQTVLGDFRLIPIVMGDQSFEFCRKLAESIVEVCRDRKVLLVASSDLSHYHSHQEATRLDKIVAERLESFDTIGLSRELQEGRCEACGGGPMMTVMMAAGALGANKARVLRYANSGDVTGDNRQVVGYLAAAFYANPGSSKDRKRSERVGVDLGLSDDEKKTLRELAYQAIRSRCLGDPLPAAPTPSARLGEPRGAFVCIKKGGDLRGCIGMIEGRGPLHETIRGMAVQAAFADPRFCALKREELDEIEIEISVLTPLERITDPAQIEIGKHGLYIRKEYYSGLLLPQVATEHGWDRIELLEWTCRKAGLPPDAWKGPDIEIYIFSADIF